MRVDLVFKIKPVKSDRVHGDLIWWDWITREIHS